ncbi:hypothetical protein [Streptomyces rubellomurinus]|uniref:hypothetical protein n=1 Tax=Streptomyces rubellomurinus (strain ATCC 31215) TaxID=359131 RepID=UPI001ABFA7CE|nr:hypothetical protein [Streptomyces rubellomurinus]
MENVKDLPAGHKAYGVKDDQGRSMDTVKIIDDREKGPGHYLAVYHTMTGGRFKVHLATSTDTVNWHWERELAGSGGPGGASQPAIVQAGAGLVAAWEQEADGGSHLAFRYFASRGDLLAGRVAKSYDAPRNFGISEGTPNIYGISLNPDIDHSTIDVGAHYFDPGARHDRQQRGTLTDFASWRADKQPGLDQALTGLGATGNIGGRASVDYGGHPYTLIEGQTYDDQWDTNSPQAWASWRIFLYDEQSRAAEQLNIRTDGGSRAFANPSIADLTAPDGSPFTAVTLFVPGETAASGEGGELVYNTGTFPVTPPAPGTDRIDVGLTVQDGRFVKGSGSYASAGGYRKVCVQILDTAGKGYGSSCRNPDTDGRQLEFSAPDLDLGTTGATAFLTRITAYDGNDRAIASKDSNTLIRLDDRIDIGLTVIDGGSIKGSGSYTSTGYQKVCVGIYNQIGIRYSEACRSPRSDGRQLEFSAPDVPLRQVHDAPGTRFRTRITAYDAGGNVVASKASNEVVFNPF